MAKLHLRDPQRERFWRSTLKTWQTSGLSIRAFCRQHRLKESAFHFWRQELRRRDSSSSVPAFLPVTVPPSIGSDTCAAAIEVRCPSGHVVAFNATDPSILKALFAALREEKLSC